MKNKLIRRFSSLALSAMLVMSLAIPAFAASDSLSGAKSSDPSNHTALQQDLAQQDIIDYDRTGSLVIHKYDITAAEAAGDYTEGLYDATGEADSRVETSLKDYAIEGVRFSYLYLGGVETYSRPDRTGSAVEIVYEIPSALADLLDLDAADAVDMTASSMPCSNAGKLHYTSTQLSDALAALLAADDILARNALENYLYQYDAQGNSAKGSAVDMAKTDANGVTSVSGLPLGLYLIVETEVPENVTATVNPWFVSLPFTDSDGEQWLYDMTCYPKNQTGNPTLDKSVRNAYSNSTADASDKNGSVESGTAYQSSAGSTALVVFNSDNASDRDAAAYVANRGGYTGDGTTAGKNGNGTSVDFQYRDTTTASEGDILDYTLVSRLPHITSTATYLTQYTFTDVLSKGMQYGQDTRIAFYHTAADAAANNTAAADVIWSGDEFRTEYAATADGAPTMVVTMTAKGLKAINEGMSDRYMVVYYTAAVRSDDSVVLGDAGNTNRVKLLWSRTSDGYYNMLEDLNYVYTYGLDLTKKFSDNNGSFDKVQFKLYNRTDAYYVIADPEKNTDGSLTGTWYVTGKTTDKSAATTLVPASDGRILIRGIEADTYALTEIATDSGYSLLKEEIVVRITASDRDVIASVAGVTGMDAAAAASIVSAYNGGIFNENGQPVTASKDELTGADASRPNAGTPNGNEIGATDLFVGALKSASARVDGTAAQMTADGTSTNADVPLTVTNQRNFLLPQTGGTGLFVVTIAGSVIALCGLYLILARRKED